MFLGGVLTFIFVFNTGTLGSNMELITSRASQPQSHSGSQHFAPTTSSVLWHNASSTSILQSSEIPLTANCSEEDTTCLDNCHRLNNECMSRFSSWSVNDALWTLTHTTEFEIFTTALGYSYLTSSVTFFDPYPAYTHTCTGKHSTGICTKPSSSVAVGNDVYYYEFGSSTGLTTYTSSLYETSQYVVFKSLKPSPTCSYDVDCFAKVAQTSSTGVDVFTSEIQTSSKYGSDCDGCEVQGGSVELIYWADMATANSSNSKPALNTSSSHITTVYKGHTLISPSVLIEFKTAYAVNGCGQLVGKTHPGAMISLDPNSLFSLVGSDDFYVETLPGGKVSSFYLTQSFDFRNLVGLVNPIVYNEMPICWEEGGCYTIYSNSYHPVLLLPSEIRSLDPAWKTCGLNFRGAWDPPIALHPARSAAMPTTSDLMPTPTPASPQSTFESPAQATSNALGDHSTPAPFPEAQPDQDSSQGSAAEHTSSHQPYLDGQKPSRPVSKSHTVSTTLQLLPPAPNVAPSATQTTSSAQANSPNQSSGDGEGKDHNSNGIGVNPNEESGPGSPPVSQATSNPNSSPQLQTTTSTQDPNLLPSNAINPDRPSSAFQYSQQGQPSASVNGQLQETASPPSATGKLVGQDTTDLQSDSGNNPQTHDGGSGSNNPHDSEIDVTSAAGNGGQPEAGVTTQTKGNADPLESNGLNAQSSVTSQSRGSSSDSMPYSVVVENGHTISFISGGLAIDATTALVGGAPATISEVVYSAKSNGGLVIVSQSVEPVGQSDAAESEGPRPTAVMADPQASHQGAAEGQPIPARTTIKGHAYTVLQVTVPSGQSQSEPIIVKGPDSTVTLVQGQVTTLSSGGEVSVNSNGQAVIEGHTVTPGQRHPSNDATDGLPDVTTVQTTLQATFAFDAKEFTAIVDPTELGLVRVNGTTLSVGGEALTSGTHTISALSAGIIKDGTMYLYTPEPTSSSASSIRAHASSARRGSSRSSEVLPDITSTSASYSDSGETTKQSTTSSASSTSVPNMGARTHSGTVCSLSAILWAALASFYL